MSEDTTLAAEESTADRKRKERDEREEGEETEVEPQIPKKTTRSSVELPYPFSEVITFPDFETYAREKVAGLPEDHSNQLLLAILAESKYTTNRDDLTWCVPPNGYSFVIRDGKVVGLSHPRLPQAISIAGFNRTRELVHIGYTERVMMGGRYVYFPRVQLQLGVLQLDHVTKKISPFKMDGEAVHLRPALQIALQMKEGESKKKWCYLLSDSSSPLSYSDSCRLATCLENASPVASLLHLASEVGELRRGLQKLILAIAGILQSDLSITDKFKVATELRGLNLRPVVYNNYLTNLSMPQFAKMSTFDGVYVNNESPQTKTISRLLPSDLVAFASRALTADQWKAFDDGNTELIVIPDRQATLNRRMQRKGGRTEIVDVKRIEEYGLSLVSADALIKYRDAGMIPIESEATSRAIEVQSSSTVTVVDDF